MFARCLSAPIRLFLLCLLSLSISQQARAAKTWDEDLKSRLSSEVNRSGLSAQELGLVVGFDEGSEQNEIYTLNPDKKFIPASATKVLTAAAFLEKFGASRKFITELRSSARVREGALEGDLCLKGGGDPGFVSESMWFLVNEFVRTGVISINGSILVDDTRFDAVRTDPSRDPDRVDRAYDAPIGAMSFNWNSINVFVRPGPKVGAPAVVYLDPANTYTRLESRATTGRSGSGSTIAVTRRNEESEPGKFPKDVIVVNGSLAEGHSELVVYKNITAPDWWSGHQLLSFLSQRGIRVRGDVRVGACDRSSTQLAKAESKPMSQILQDQMKFSNNYVAEMMTKNLAAEFVSQPANMEAGMNIIREFVWSQGVPKDQVELVNPSGLTRKNSIQTRHMQLILRKLAKKFPQFAENLSSYPIAGVDGTLKNRMKGTAAEGWVRAKTGKINGVVALVGYVGRQDGRMLTFTFFFNGKDGQTPAAMSLFDKLCLQMVK